MSPEIVHNRTHKILMGGFSGRKKLLLRYNSVGARLALIRGTPCRRMEVLPQMKCSSRFPFAVRNAPSRERQAMNGGALKPNVFQEEVSNES